MKRVAEAIRNGGIALALSSAALYFGLLLFSAADIMGIYMFFPDVGETVSSVRIVHDYGFFGTVPQLGNGGYSFFGSMPPLFPAMAQVIYSVLGDAALSAFLLNAIVSVAAAALIFQVVDGGMEMKALAVLLLLVNVFTGAMFPFVVRARSLLAMLFFLLAIHLEKKGTAGRGAYFLCFLAAFLSQPLVAGLGAALLSWRIFARGGDRWKLAAMALALAISIPFYYKLMVGAGAEPRSLGSSAYDVRNDTLIPVYGTAFLAFSSALRGKEKNEALPALAFLLLPLANTASYMITGRLDQTLFANVLFGSDLVYAAFFAPSAAFLLSFYGSRLSRSKIAAGLLFAIAGIGVAGTYGYVLHGAADFQDKMQLIEGIDEAASKLLVVPAVESGGKVWMIHGDFMISGLAVATGRNISFVGNLIPPQLDKGPEFSAAMELANGNVSDCDGLVAGMGDADMLIYITNSPKLNWKLDGWAKECGLVKKEFGTSYGGAIAAYSMPKDG